MLSFVPFQNGAVRKNASAPLDWFRCELSGRIDCLLVSGAVSKPLRKDDQPKICASDDTAAPHQENSNQFTVTKAAESCDDAGQGHLRSCGVAPAWPQLFWGPVAQNPTAGVFLYYERNHF
jgi:hypothetical protein